jgi:hypothetical protein
VVEEVRWSSRALSALVGVFLFTLAWLIASAIPAPPRGRELLIRLISVAGFAIAFGSVALIFTTLRISVDHQTLTIGFGPFRERIPLERLVACESVTYRWVEWGGWGIRYRHRGKMYNVPGDRGIAVQLELENGRRIFFSSRDPETICRTLAEYRPNIYTS